MHHSHVCVIGRSYIKVTSAGPYKWRPVNTEREVHDRISVKETLLEMDLVCSRSDTAEELIVGY